MPKFRHIFHQVGFTSYCMSAHALSLPRLPVRINEPLWSSMPMAHHHRGHLLSSALSIPNLKLASVHTRSTDSSRRPPGSLAAGRWSGLRIGPND